MFCVTGEQQREEVTPERVVQALADIAFRDSEEVKTGERMKALELLGKHLGMWGDKARENSLEEERSRLSELLEQRRERGRPNEGRNEV